MDDDDRFARLNAPHWGMARIILTGGPFDGEVAFSVPPDTAAPAQIVWGGWLPWGFDAWLYEWHGERTTWDGGLPPDLIYRPTGRRLAAAEIPSDVGKTAELYVDSTLMALAGLDVPAELIWPGR